MTLVRGGTRFLLSAFVMGLAACAVDGSSEEQARTVENETVAKQSLALAPSMLHTQGRNIVNASGQVVPLRGFNLGGWLVFEKWMTPMDSGSLADNYAVLQQLDNRFGIATEQSLIKSYQQAWLTTLDLDNVRNAGYNALRVPVWYGNFYPINNISNGGWRSDAFEMLDWVVNNAGARGLYVIIDMHGAVGGQSTADHTGRSNQNQYWNSDNNKGNTAWMWWQIANRYKGNPTVAGYDLLNEPTGAPNTQAVWDAYRNLYSSIRSVDPDHMIFMEGTFGNWNWSMLPPPSQYGWTNVVYEMHEYQFNGTEAQVRAGTDRQVADFNNHASWNVPGYIGEFNCFDYPNAWTYTKNAYNNAGLSWTMWSYKSTNALNPTPWGWYGPTSWRTTPNISSNSADAIRSAWQQWQTSTSFAKNTRIGL
ncbi:glycoside hydrolase family 5 protein [Pendulispora brunnea]|uniref:Glycoside hydrolase family 5 protein n=1 Tax=Pendulispora brunnea TaxID=2905690 RepID=A0ABZ2K7R6_9BACT